MTGLRHKIEQQVNYGLQVYQADGLRGLLHEFARQLYSRDRQVGVYVDLERLYGRQKIKTPVDYSLETARDGDMEDIFRRIEREGGDSSHLLDLKSLYRHGFHRWYIARDKDDESCFVCSCHHPDENAIISGYYGNSIAPLGPGEVLFEGAFTFKKYRGKGLGPSVHERLMNKYYEAGFRRALVYINGNDPPSYRLVEKLGCRKFMDIRITRVLFKTLKSPGL